MNLKVNACSPSFGMVSDRAAKLAKDQCLRAKDKEAADTLVEEQDKNPKYHIADNSADYEARESFPYYIVYSNGHILERFKDFLQACNFASAVENAAKENGAL